MPSPFQWMIVGTLVGACGPMYGNPPAQQQQPGQPPAQPLPAPTPATYSGPPGGGADRDEPVVEVEDGDAEADEAPARPAPPEPEPQAEKLGADQRKLLDAHNRVRAKHCAAPLAWSAKLAAFAQEWADSLVKQGCKFGHSNGRYGENLAAGTTGTLDGNAVTAMWYDEIEKYDFGSGGFSMETGHFTQVVWRDTKQIGCARSQCNRMDIWVCEYESPGNVQGGYRANVLPTSCKR